MFRKPVKGLVESKDLLSPLTVFLSDYYNYDRNGINLIPQFEVL